MKKLNTLVFSDIGDLNELMPSSREQLLSSDGKLNHPNTFKVPRILRVKLSGLSRSKD
jgi:hypothetical protein